MVVGSHSNSNKQMNQKSISPRMIADYEERRNALLADGYRLRHETVFDDGAVCRLHHMSNGNDIVISARGHQLTQKTNHVLVHEQTY